MIDISNLEGNVSIKNFNISSENNGQNNGINIKNLRKNGNVIISNNTISIYNPIRAVDTSNYKLFIYANTISGGNSNINIQNWFGEVEISNNLLSKTRKINGTGFVILIRNLTNNYLDNKQAIFSNTIDLGWENNTSLSRGFGIRFGDFKENNLINNWSGFSNIDIHNNNIINAKPHRHGIFIFNNSKPSEKLMKPTINISDNNIKGTLGGGGNGIILIDNVKEASLNSNIIEDMNKEMVIYSNLTDYFYQNSN